MLTAGSIRVLRPGDARRRRVAANVVGPDDIVLSGDMRSLNLADEARGRRRFTIRTGFANDTDKLVYVQKTLSRSGYTYRYRQWVRGDNVKPGDTVLLHAHNVRPYRHAARDGSVAARPAGMAPATDQAGASAYRAPMGPNMDASHARRATALFRLLAAMGRIG